MTEPTKRGRGRPSKKDIAANSPGGRGKVGRPKGDATIINEYKARMLASPKSEAVLHKILDTALDDEHRNQAACMKMVADRILPLSYFDKDSTNKGIGGITISINQATPGDVAIDGEVIDHE